HAQLARRQQAIGDGHAQHRRMALQVKPVAQAQRPEFVFRQAAIEETPRLVAELVDALGYERRVDFVISVHGGTLIDRAGPMAGEPVILACGRVICQPVVCRPWAMPLTLASNAWNRSWSSRAVARQRRSRSTCIRFMGST